MGTSQNIKSHTLTSTVNFEVAKAGKCFLFYILMFSNKFRFKNMALMVCFLIFLKLLHTYNSPTQVFSLMCLNKPPHGSGCSHTVLACLFC